MSLLALAGQLPRPVVGTPVVSEQWPTLPAFLHEWHGWLGSHGESQHTPSTQLPELHCAPALQA